MNKNKDIEYSIDAIRKAHKSLTIIGWANSADPDDKVYLDVMDSSHKSIKYHKDRTRRNDVSVARYSDIIEQRFGFSLSFPYEPHHTYLFRLYNKNDEVIIKINDGYIWKDNLWKKVAAFVWRKPLKDVTDASKIGYTSWYRKTRPTEAELIKQKLYQFPDNAPKFSIIIPLYNTPKRFLEALINSIKDQTYTNFEVCFADGSPAETKLEKDVEYYSGEDTRFKYHFIGENKGISGNTNEAVKMAEGDFIVLCDHDDLITPNALYEFAKATLDNPECDSIYSDEDKIDAAGRKYFEPHFKPDFNIDLLSTNNYICHLFSVRKSLVDKYGAFNSEFDGAQDFDFILRMTENSRKVIHVQKILYHWRTHQNSTSAHPESKAYAFKAGAKAIESYYRRVRPEIQIERVENGASLGIYHTCFKFDAQPLVSVVIPNMDHSEDLDAAIRSLITKGTWKNLEIVIVENNSKEEKTFQYYDNIQKEFPQVQVVHYKEAFNYSKLNNFGVQYTHGDYILLMNNDVELINPDSITEMMGYAQRNDVGIVGCRLLYADNTIQHAGVVIGVDGIAGHVFKGFFTDDTYLNLAMTTQDYSAVTAAVMLVRKDVYEKVNGFDEDFAVAFNDIDFCLRVRKINKLIVYAPYACFHHYESKSRGQEDTYEKQLRFVSEIKRFLIRWKDVILQGDPYYNQNLTVHAYDYGYRNLSVEKIGDSFYGEEYINYIITHEPNEIVKSN